MALLCVCSTPPIFGYFFLYPEKDSISSKGKGRKICLKFLGSSVTDWDAWLKKINDNWNDLGLSLIALSIKLQQR